MSFLGNYAYIQPWMNLIFMFRAHVDLDVNFFAGLLWELQSVMLYAGGSLA